MTGADPSQTRRDIYSVSRLNREARGLLESALPSLWIEGEMSNLSRPASGHWYFTLKDEAAQVRCAMFRGRNHAIATPPRDGQQVLLRARVGLYEARGEYQLVVDHLEEAGEGELRRQFEQLKQRLGAEGLFDAALKRTPPALPRRVGVVTSPTGAALQDVLQVLRRRFPAVGVLVYPVPVQGAGAGAGIAAMLKLAGERKEVEVLLLVRGGGSLEDLWAFNEEVVARAIRACPLPVVTGVGHEVDFTIADLAADLRAPTPSAAAELVVPDAQSWRDKFAQATKRAGQALARLLLHRRETLTWAQGRLGQLHPAQLILQRQQRTDELLLRLQSALRQNLQSRHQALATRQAQLAARSPASRLALARQRHADARRRLLPALNALLGVRRAQLQSASRAMQAVSPLATLDRGYAIVTAAGGQVLMDAEQAAVGSEIEARLARGVLRARVLPGRKEE